MKMNAAVKADWINLALKGGYAQGKYYLEFKSQAGPVCYCIQGLLVRLYELAHPTEPLYKFDSVVKKRIDNPGTVTFFDGACGALPDKVMAWAGMPVRNIHQEATLEQVEALNQRDRKLAHLGMQNDTGSTFIELASYIATHL